MDAKQQYSYDLTKQLTFFVISAEMLFCGYVLLNAKEFSNVEYASSLFLISGLAAISGVLWRVFYNETFHARSHQPPKGHKHLGRGFRIAVIGIRIFYPLYVLLSILFFCALLALGYNYLQDVAINNQHQQEAADSNQ